jgi:hypothetical protein
MPIMSPTTLPNNLDKREQYGRVHKTKIKLKNFAKYYSSMFWVPISLFSFTYFHVLSSYQLIVISPPFSPSFFVELTSFL